MWFEVEEFIYDEASSSDESDEDDVGFEDATQSEFVLHRFTDNKYYAAVVFENTANHVVLRCAKKIGVQSNSVTFVWPSREYHVVVDIETFSGSDFKKLPFPTFGRRGSISFDMQTFGKVFISYLIDSFISFRCVNILLSKIRMFSMFWDMFFGTQTYHLYWLLFQ